MTRRTVHIAQVLWPAFLVAGVLEMVVFALVDPASVRVGGWEPESTTAYSLAFITFWMLVATASGMSQWLRGAQPVLQPVTTRGARRGR